MKTLRYITCAAAVCAVLAAAAQDHYRSHFWVGAHAGGTVARMSFKPGVPQTWLPGANIGIQARYAEEKNFGLIAELNLDQRGWRERFDDNPELSYQRRLTYVEVPLLTHINFGARRTKFYANLGPQFGFLLSDKTSSNFDYTDPKKAGLAATRTTYQLTMPVKNRFDYGITGALGLEWYIKPRHSVYFDVRYYFGLGNIYSASKSDPFSASRATAIQATLGYWLRLK